MDTISIAYDDAVEVVELEAESSLPTMLPSMVYLHRDSLRLAGTQSGETFMVTGRERHKCAACPLVYLTNGEADTNCRTYFRGGGCMDSRLLAGLKLDLADESFFGTHSWAVDFTVEDLVAVALRRLKSIADQACGSDVRRAVFGFPLAFPGTEGPEFGRRKGLAWARLEDAARLAGFEEVERLAEPHAAAIVEETETGTVLAVDFGGGTFDVAVIEFTPDSAEVTALQGAAMGGERIDADIFQTKVASALGLDATFSGTSGASLSACPCGCRIASEAWPASSTWWPTMRSLYGCVSTPPARAARVWLNSASSCTAARRTPSTRRSSRPRSSWPRWRRPRSRSTGQASISMSTSRERSSTTS